MNKWMQILGHERTPVPTDYVPFDTEVTIRLNSFDENPSMERIKLMLGKKFTQRDLAWAADISYGAAANQIHTWKAKGIAKVVSRTKINGLVYNVHKIV